MWRAVRGKTEIALKVLRVKMIFLKGSLQLLACALLFSTAKVINAIPLSSAAASEAQSSGRPQYYLVPQHYLQQHQNQQQTQYISAPQTQTYQAAQSGGGAQAKYSSPTATHKVAQLLLPSSVDRQVAKAAQQVAGPQYAQEIQYVQQQGLANEAIATAQRRAQAIYRRAQQQAQLQAQQQQYLAEVTPSPKQQQQPHIQYIQSSGAAAGGHQPQQQQQEYQIQYEAAYQQPTYVARAPAAHYKAGPAKLKAPAEEEPEEEHDNESTYQFGFDVKDDLYTNYQNRKEQRENGKISGSYSVVDSDGFIRTVTYTADPKEGFKAEVVRKPTDIVVKIPKPREQPEEHQYIHTLQQNDDYQQPIYTQQKYHQQQQPASQSAAKEKIVYRYQ